MNRRDIIAVVLVPVALAASWWAWQLRPKPTVVDNVGPERSDYTAEIYHLVVMDKDGDVSFRSNGPYAARDPNNQQLFLNQPQFSFPDHNGEGDWKGHSETGWVSAAGDEVRLKRAVVLDGPIVPGKDQVHIRSEQMTVFPDPQTAHSDVLVTITRGASILLGTGMNAWMKTSRVELLSKVSFHDVPIKKH
jgi:lipopolysaccharide export system protein LptC